MTNAVDHSWLQQTVKPYFESKGIVLLREDITFIDECLQHIPQKAHRSMLKSYFNVWSATIANNEISSSKPVNARRKANTFLRENTVN